MVKIGDWVEVVSPGEMYSRYVGMAQIMGLTKWAKGAYPNPNEKFQVINIRTHENPHEGKIVAIQSEDNTVQFMIGFEGLTKVKPPSSPLLLPEELFDI